MRAICDPHVTGIAARAQFAICSFVYDNPGVHNVLMNLFGRGPALDVQVLVDRAHHQRRTCPYQADRLQDLLARRATVKLGSSVGENGVMHLKTVAVDNRVVYLGSASVTLASSGSSCAHRRW